MVFPICFCFCWIKALLAHSGHYRAMGSKTGGSGVGEVVLELNATQVAVLAVRTVYQDTRPLGGTPAGDALHSRGWLRVPLLDDVLRVRIDVNVLEDGVHKSRHKRGIG